MKCGNLDAYKPHALPPAQGIEPVLCELCIRLAKMGRLLMNTKKGNYQKKNHDDNVFKLSYKFNSIWP